jgi:hypothetical protein
LILSIRSFNESPDSLADSMGVLISLRTTPIGVSCIGGPFEISVSIDSSIKQKREWVLIIEKDHTVNQVKFMS